MTKESICNECGYENNQDSKYCSSCGTPLESQHNEVQKSNDRQKNEHISLVIIGYILSFVFVPVGLVIGLYLITQKAVKDKKHGWIIFGIAFTIAFLGFFIMLSEINSNISSIHWQLYDIYYRMGQMRLY